MPMTAEQQWTKNEGSYVGFYVLRHIGNDE